MRVPRLYVDQALQVGSSYLVSAEDDHHLRRVLRMQPGDPVLVSDGRGRDFGATLQAGGRVALVDEREPVPEPPVDLTLCVALARGERFEGVLEKAGEMGVSSIVPILSERCTVRELSQSRLMRWRRIAREASALAGRPRYLRVEELVPLAKLLRQAPGVMFSAGYPPFDGVAAHGRLLIGPEGGFSPDEVEQAAQFGWTLAGLGPRTLRVETAATVAATLALWRAGGDLGALE